MRARSAPAYRRRFHVHFPEALAEAVEHSADAKMTSINSWIRQGVCSRFMWNLAPASPPGLVHASFIRAQPRWRRSQRRLASRMSKCAPDKPPEQSPQPRLTVERTGKASGLGRV
jgi:hypothetical protein